jgi:hypothetical protein
LIRHHFIEIIIRLLLYKPQEEVHSSSDDGRNDLDLRFEQDFRRFQNQQSRRTSSDGMTDLERYFEEGIRRNQPISPILPISTPNNQNYIDNMPSPSFYHSFYDTPPRSRASSSHAPPPTNLRF